MKAVVGRIRKLEIQLGTAMRKAVPSGEEVVVRLLAAGDWQSALEMLDRRERGGWQEQQTIECLCRVPTGMIDIDLTDLTQMRQTFTKSLGHLPQELRCEIARKLYPADPN